MASQSISTPISRTSPASCRAAYRATEGFSDGTDADLGVSSVLYYLLAYTFMNIGAFAIVAWIQQRGRGMELEDFYGLGASHPADAMMMTSQW